MKNIHLGPTLPAFLSPNVAKVLVENFGIGGINNVEDDIEMFKGFFLQLMKNLCLMNMELIILSR